MALQDLAAPYRNPLDREIHVKAWEIHGNLMGIHGKAMDRLEQMGDTNYPLLKPC